MTDFTVPLSQSWWTSDFYLLLQCSEVIFATIFLSRNAFKCIMQTHLYFKKSLWQAKEFSALQLEILHGEKGRENSEMLYLRLKISTFSENYPHTFERKI